jgi:predicted RNA binding protein YcfA (HicA-like mRNA interferase family)
VKDVQELLRSRRERELHQELQKVTDAINTLEDRFRSNVPARRVHTDPEREALRVLLASYKDDKTRLQRELGVAEKVKDEPGLFGLGAVPGYKWRRVMSGREVARMLEHNEWTYQRTSGSHMNFKKGECRVTVPDHTELKKGTLASIKRVVEECESSLNLP